MINEPVILASGSPQRKRILADLNIPYKAISSNVDEDPGNLKDAAQIAEMLALKKARSVADKNPQSWVVGCDTLVVLPDGQISMKPESRQKAKWTLQQYAGRHCDVYSGLALIHKAAEKELTGIEKTRLYFHDFDEEAIESYLDLNHWQGSSGSMTIEGEGGKLIRKIEGDYWNVVGLPVELLKRFFKQAKIG